MPRVAHPTNHVQLKAVRRHPVVDDIREASFNQCEVHTKLRKQHICYWSLSDISSTLLDRTHHPHEQEQAAAAGFLQSAWIWHTFPCCTTSGLAAVTFRHEDSDGTTTYRQRTRECLIHTCHVLLNDFSTVRLQLVPNEENRSL